MPRILIAGCGYVGEATADLFFAEGWEVEGWTASAESAERLKAKPYAVRAVDLLDANALAASEKQFDAVIHCASSRGGTADDYRRVYLQGANNLAAAFPDALLVYTSSTSVYAQTDGGWVTEQSAAEPQRETGRVLRETEKFVLAHGGIVTRVAGIYGPGRSALLRKFLSGDAVLDPSSDRFSNQAHRDDIAAALLLLVRRYVRAPRLQNSHLRVFNVADGSPLPVRECYATLARLLHRPLPPESETALPRKRGNSNKRVSSAKLQALGWTPRYPDFGSAMAQSILPNLERCGA
jgi:nucleoside-diphosphate-sugar epimerase